MGSPSRRAQTPSEIATQFLIGPSRGEEARIVVHSDAEASRSSQRAMAVRLRKATADSLRENTERRLVSRGGNRTPNP